MLSLLELDNVSSGKGDSFGSTSAVRGVFCFVVSCVELFAARLLVFFGL